MGWEVRDDIVGLKEQGTFTPMPQVSKEEMLHWLMAVERDLFRTDEGWTKTDKRICGAIRALIVATGEWREYIRISRLRESYLDHIILSKLLGDIDDFGKEK